MVNGRLCFPRYDEVLAKEHEERRCIVENSEWGGGCVKMGSRDGLRVAFRRE
jgi:hypothetical protein